MPVKDVQGESVCVCGVCVCVCGGGDVGRGGGRKTHFGWL